MFLKCFFNSHIDVLYNYEPGWMQVHHVLVHLYFFQPDTSMTVICDTEAFKEGGSRAYWLQYGRYMCDTVYGTADGFTSTFWPQATTAIAGCEERINGPPTTPLGKQRALTPIAHRPAGTAKEAIFNEFPLQKGWKVKTNTAINVKYSNGPSCRIAYLETFLRIQHRQMLQNITL